MGDPGPCVGALGQEGRRVGALWLVQYRRRYMDVNINVDVDGDVAVDTDL